MTAPYPTFGKNAAYVIIGAGFAGASTAYHLARSGSTNVLLLEQEQVPGVHSSGRNASVIREVGPEPPVAELLHLGASFIRNLPGDWPIPVSYRQSGSLLIARGPQWDALRQEAEAAGTRTVVEYWSRDRAERTIPLLKGADFEGVLWCPTDGVVDIHALLTGYLKGAQSAGVRVLYGVRVHDIETSSGRVTAVITDDGPIDADVVINAAGPWAGAVGTMAEASEIEFHPCRRHLFVTPPLDWIDPDWPFVLNVSDEVYFRPESGGLLLSPCDQEELPPGDPPTDISIIELLAERIRQAYPEFPDVAVARYWAGFRTFSDDGRFVIGWDPQREGFFWAAGLAGHGVTTSAAVGALGAELLLSGEENPTFSPARFGDP